MANFAERIRALRKEKGLSQEEVGSVIGLKKYAVYSYEKGRANSLIRQNRVTVFPIEDISGYRYSSVAGNGYGCDLTESYFEEAEWYLRFVLRGEDRLSINLDSRNQKRCISLSSAMEEIQLGESTAPDMEEMIVQQMVTESMMDMLTDKQKELIYALYFEKQTYQEYADIHGISSAAVNNMRNKAVAKLRASLEELAESNEKKKLRKK